jgi:2'-hydroxyisoflavone reductase
MKVLVIGGSTFLGRTYVEEAVRRGFEVTTFNRGVSGTDLPEVEAVHGDREVAADLERLVAGGRRWDMVVDTPGYVPRVVGAAARLLADRVSTYVFISSISASGEWPARIADESTALECPPDAGPEDGDYGVLKAGCERAVMQALGDRGLVIRPGLILGPYENVGRLPTWLNRMSRGGRLLAPGRPDKPMQLVDARDIVLFTYQLVEAGTSGEVFQVTAPAGNATYASWLGDCREVTGADAELVWVEDRFLLDHDVQPWTELPLWTPDGPEFAHVWAASTAKAEAAGLRCRPVQDTVRDTWQWICTDGLPEFRKYDHMGPHGIDPDKERAILAAWDRR